MLRIFGSVGASDTACVANLGPVHNTKAHAGDIPTGAPGDSTDIPMSLVESMPDLQFQADLTEETGDVRVANLGPVHNTEQILPGAWPSLAALPKPLSEPSPDPSSQVRTLQAGTGISTRIRETSREGM